MEGVGQEGWENIENEDGWMDGRRDAIKEKRKKQNGEKKKKTVRKPQLKMHNHTQKMHAKSNIKIREVAGRALDCEPEGQTSTSPRSQTSPASHV